MTKVAKPSGRNLTSIIFLLVFLFVLRSLHNGNQTNDDFRIKSKRITQNTNDKKSTSSAERQGITKDASIAKHIMSSTQAAAKAETLANIQRLVANATSTAKQTESPLLLSVPFFVYEELAWPNATFHGKAVRDWATERNNKHWNDYWFLMASLKHPMRTRDPSQAKLFVIPILMNFYDGRSWSPEHLDLCWKDMCNDNLLDYASLTLKKSLWFQQYPERHIVVASHYASSMPSWRERHPPKSLKKALYQCNTITFENAHHYVSPERLTFPSYSVGRACDPVDTKLYDVALIATRHTDRAGFEDREFVCHGLGFGSSSNSTTSNAGMPICGPGEQCPALAQAKLGFHVRGDTFGSNRLMDTVLSGTVPIFTRIEQFAIQPPWINWTKLSYFVDLANLTSPEDLPKFLHNILVHDKEGMEQRHKEVLDNRNLFDWTTLFPFDTYMYMLQAHLYPDTRKGSSRWGALILPPPHFENMSNIR